MSRLGISRRQLCTTVATLPILASTLLSCSQDATTTHPVAESSNELRALQQFIEHLFPLEKVAVDMKQEIAVELYEQAKTDVSLKELLTNAQRGLDDAVNGDWISTELTEQISVMKTVENDPWFIAIRFRAQGLFFANEGVGAAIGYQGPSIYDGGYINRGFDDIDWLPKAVQ